MSKWGNMNFNELKEFQKKLENLQQNKAGLFVQSCARELAARLLRKVIKRTLPGQYPKGSGKTGGTLRRGWTAGIEQDASKYVKNLEVERTGDIYNILVFNPVEYAAYVEYGHRTANHKGWVKGKFMLSISEEELQMDAPKILEQKLAKKLKEVFK